MKQFTLIATLIISLLNFAYGQNKTYLGFEFSVANDLYEITDTGDYLVTIPLIDGQGGLTLRQELNRSIYVETGLIIKYYQEGFGFKTIPGYSSGSSEASVIIPLRFGLNLNLYKEKIYLVPVIGYSFGINPPYGYGISWGTQTSSTTTYDFYSTENPDVSRYFSLLQTGIGFEFAIAKALLFSISTNYYHGFNKTAQWNITYTVNNSDPMTGSTISKGEFWGVGAGIRYPISNLWAMK